MNAEPERYDLETPRSEANYMCFTLDTDEDQAAQIFKARYGYWPEQILEEKGLLWLGPIQLPPGLPQMPKSMELGGESHPDEL